jgi:hypothetical protein
MKFSNTHYFLAGVLVTIVLMMVFRKTAEGFQDPIDNKTKIFGFRKNLQRMPDTQIRSIWLNLIKNDNEFRQDAGRLYGITAKSSAADVKSAALAAPDDVVLKIENRIAAMRNSTA